MASFRRLLCAIAHADLSSSLAWVLGVDDVEVVVVAEEDNTCCLISLFSLDNVIALK
jgi:hypothetical protein